MNKKLGQRAMDLLAQLQKLQTKLSCNSEQNTLAPQEMSSDFAKDEIVAGARTWCSSF